METAINIGFSCKVLREGKHDSKREKIPLELLKWIFFFLGGGLVAYGGLQLSGYTLFINAPFFFYPVGLALFATRHDNNDP